jgi:hypothetical protein
MKHEYRFDDGNRGDVSSVLIYTRNYPFDVVPRERVVVIVTYTDADDVYHTMDVPTRQEDIDAGYTIQFGSMIPQQSSSGGDGGATAPTPTLCAASGSWKTLMPYSPLNAPPPPPLTTSDAVTGREIQVVAERVDIPVVFIGTAFGHANALLIETDGYAVRSLDPRTDENSVAASSLLYSNDDGQLTAVCFANTNTENSCYSFYAQVDEYRLCLHKEGCSSCADLGTEWKHGINNYLDCVYSGITEHGSGSCPASGACDNTTHSCFYMYDGAGVGDYAHIWALKSTYTASPPPPPVSRETVDNTCTVDSYLDSDTDRSSIGYHYDCYQGYGNYQLQWCSKTDVSDGSTYTFCYDRFVAPVPTDFELSGIPLGTVCKRKGEALSVDNRRNTRFPGFGSSSSALESRTTFGNADEVTVDIEIADLNNDGFKDVITIEDGGYVRIYRGNRFNSGTRLDFSNTVPETVRPSYRPDGNPQYFDDRAGDLISSRRRALQSVFPADVDGLRDRFLKHSRIAIGYKGDTETTTAIAASLIVHHSSETTDGGSCAMRCHGIDRMGYNSFKLFEPEVIFALDPDSLAQYYENGEPTACLCGPKYEALEAPVRRSTPHRKIHPLLLPHH